MKLFTLVARQLLVAIASIIFLVPSVLAQTAVTFNGKNQYLEMTPWVPTGEYKIVAWLGDVNENPAKRTYLTSNSTTNDYLAFYGRSVQAHFGKSYPGVWKKFDFRETRYFEVTIKDGQMIASDGNKTASVKHKSITTENVSYDLVFKRGNRVSKGALQSIAFIDVNNKSNSRTIAFDEQGYPIVISEQDIYVGGVNMDSEDTIDDLDIPSPKLDIVKNAHALGEKIKQQYPGMPLLTLDLNNADVGRKFAWEGYYWLRTYINLYKATEDTEYLKWAMNLTEFMLFNTDELRAFRSGRFTNDYTRAPRAFIEDRSSFGPGWTQKHSHNGLTVLVDGMILNGIMRLVDVIKSDELEEFDAAANYYMARSKDIVESHDSSWSETKQGSIEGSWYYVVREVVPESHSGLFSNPLSYNHSLTMATAMLLIDKWSGGEDGYKDKITKLERFFRDHVTFNSDGTCDWDYAWYNNMPGRSEDINHGHIDVGFFALAEEEGYLSDDSIPRCMAKTVVKRVAIGPGVIPNYVSGEGVSPSSELISVSYDYRDLAKFEPSIIERSNNILKQFVDLSWFRQYAALSETFVD